MINLRDSSLTHTTGAAGAARAQGAPACPACGGLECLCRPRFFAGQLLTEEDLNRLDRYIVGKNRLHNRMLFGWGVVNGLEVRCGPCKDEVIVSSGYALSPCGDDIVVCADTAVPVCQLADDCCDRAGPDCGPYAPVSNPDCQDVTQKWVLAICYDEKPSRGVTPLRNTGAAACCSRCACGGSSACGCACHEKKPATVARTTNRSAGRAAAPQCEPTVICEGYRFVLFQPERPQGKSTDTSLRAGISSYLANPRSGLAQGALSERFAGCIEELVALLEQIQPPRDADVNRLYEWCCSVKQAFADFLADNRSGFCDLDDALAGFWCPDPRDFSDDAERYRKAVEAEIGRLTSLMSRSQMACLCSALLPPVPPASANNCVPIATVTIRRRDCRVISVCNLEARKFAVTFTNLAYWLSPLETFVERFRQQLTRLCCATPRRERPVPFIVARLPRERTLRRAGFTRVAAGDPAAVARRFEQVWARRQAGQSEPRAFILDALGLAREDGRPYLSDVERDDPTQTLLIDQLIAPFIEGLAGLSQEALEDDAGGAAPGEEPAVEPPASAAAPLADELAAMRAQLDGLAELVSRQADEIARLRQARGARGRGADVN